MTAKSPPDPDERTVKEREREREVEARLLFGNPVSQLGVKSRRNRPRNLATGQGGKERSEERGREREREGERERVDDCLVA